MSQLAPNLPYTAITRPEVLNSWVIKVRRPKLKPYKHGPPDRSQTKSTNKERRIPFCGYLGTVSLISRNSLISKVLIPFTFLSAFHGEGLLSDVLYLLETVLDIGFEIS